MTDKKEDGWFGLKEKLFDFMLYIILWQNQTHEKKHFYL